MGLRTVEYPLHKPRISNGVRIKSWNVYYGDSPRHGDDVVAAIQKSDCDIVALYELDAAQRIPEKLRDELGYGGMAVGLHSRRILRPFKGEIALFSRFPIGEYRVVTTHHGLTQGQRCYIEARVRISPTFSLTVGMTHHPIPGDLGYRHACEVLLREVSKHTERYVFVSDLNALWWFKIARQLRTRLVHLGPDHRLPSHPTSRWVSWLPKRRIDFAFCTPDVAEMLVESRFGESSPSDHSPIILHLRTNE